MKKHSYILALIILLAIAQTSCASVDPFPQVILPVHPNSQYKKEIYDNNSPRKILYSEILSQYPASEIIKFYDSEMNKLGYYPFSDDGYGLRRWEVFNEKTGDWAANNEIPGRYIATWVDTSMTLRVILSIRYQYNYKDQDWKNKLIVNISVQPFFVMPQGERDM